MRNIIVSVLAVVTSVALFGLTGCSSAGVAYVQPSTGKQIEIFRDGAKPSRAVREIGLLTDNGSLGEQGEIEGKFVKQARRAGADAVLFHPLTKSGGELQGFGIVETYLFKATLVVYTQ